jgi:hypothetical protein
MGLLGDVLSGLALPGGVNSGITVGGCVVVDPKNPRTLPASNSDGKTSNSDGWTRAEQQASIMAQNYAKALDDLKHNKSPVAHVKAAAQATEQAFQELDQDFDKQYAIATQSRNAQQRAVATQQMCNDLQLAQNIIQNQHAFQRQFALEAYKLAQQHNQVAPDGNNQSSGGLTPAQQAALQNQWAQGAMSPLTGMSQNGTGSAASSNPMSSMMSMLPMMLMPAMMGPMMIPGMISGLAGRQPAPGSQQGAQAAGDTSPDGGAQAVNATGTGGDGQTQTVADTTLQPDARTQPASTAASIGNPVPFGPNTDVRLPDGTTTPNAEAAIAARAALNGTAADEAYQQPGAFAPGGFAARRRRGMDRPADVDKSSDDDDR